MSFYQYRTNSILSKHYKSRVPITHPHTFTCGQGPSLPLTFILPTYTYNRLAGTLYLSPLSGSSLKAAVPPCLAFYLFLGFLKVSSFRRPSCYEQESKNNCSYVQPSAIQCSFPIPGVATCFFYLLYFIFLYNHWFQDHFSKSDAYPCIAFFGMWYVVS